MAGQPLEKKVLKEYKARILKVVAVYQIYRKLCDENVIDDGVERTITNSRNVHEARGRLFDHMMDYGNLESLKTFCHVITSEDYKGFPAMQDLGSDMKRALGEDPPPTDDKDITTVKPGPADREGGSPATITYPTDITEALGNKVDAKWKHFGTYLRFDPDVMDTIKANNGECADRMLDLVTKWMKKDKGTGDLPRTWETVVNAVKASDHKQLAEELAKKFGVTITWQ